jgi:hypothetical protein
LAAPTDSSLSCNSLNRKGLVDTGTLGFGIQFRENINLHVPYEYEDFTHGCAIVAYERKPDMIPERPPRTVGDGLYDSALVATLLTAYRDALL